MKRLLKKPLVLVPLLLLVAGFAYRQSGGSGLDQRYKFQAVEQGSVSQTVSANGTLNPVTLVSVGTQVSGMVRKLYVDFNDKVEKGQVLLELDDSLLAAQAKQSAAGVENAAAAIDLAAANEKRMKELFAQEYVSRQEFDQAVQAHRSARAQLNLARAQAEKDRANLGYTVIRSPVSGVVVARSIDVGQTVAASFQTPTLFQIAQDLSKMQIDSNFAEADIGSIRVGQAVRFNVDAFPSRAFKGVVRQVRLNPTTQQNVVTYNVVVAVDNPDQTLLPGMTAYVNIAVDKREDALLVPNGALRFKPADTSAKPDQKGGKSSAEKPMKRKRDASAGTVYVLRDGELKPVSVALGISDNRNTEVTGGDLKVGDRVVVGDAQPAAPQASRKSVGVRMF
ncbi:MAG: efflux RND transporter periplasmic adaptor subunit [Sulfuricellaceae bacterium]